MTERKSGDVGFKSDHWRDLVALDRFDEQAAVYFYGGGERNKKTVKAIRIKNFVTGVEVEAGRVRIDEGGIMVWFPGEYLA